MTNSQKSAAAPSSPSTPSPPTNSNASSTRTIKSRTARRAGAAAAVSVGGFLAVLSIWFPTIQTCKAATGTTNNVFVSIPSCSPWGVSELIPFVLVGLVLIYPEISEISITNLFTLKRQVDAQKAEVDATKERQEAVEARLTAQIQSLTSTQSSTNTQTIILDGGQISALPANIARKGRELAGVSTQERDHDISRSSTQNNSSQDQLSMELIRLWENMRPFVDYPRTGRQQDLVYPLSDEQANALKRWRVIFRTELETVRACRNTIAHGRNLESDALAAAVDAARELTGYLTELDLLRPD